MEYTIMYGIPVTDPEVIALLQDAEIVKHMLKHEGREPGFWEVSEAVKKDNPKCNFEWYRSAGKQVHIFGRLYSGMGQNETRSEFETSVVNAIKKVFKFDAEPDTVVVENDY
jgi:hypothetical protein